MFLPRNPDSCFINYDILTLFYKLRDLMTYFVNIKGVKSECGFIKHLKENGNDYYYFLLREMSKIVIVIEVMNIKGDES